MKTNSGNRIEAYFDNSATTPVYPEVRDLVVRLMEEDYGNPSSLHLKGLKRQDMLQTPERRWQDL